MPAGRPPEPVEKKRLRGNPGKRALPDRGNLALIPAVDPEVWELDTGQALQAVLESGVQWIAQTDAPNVTLLREAVEDYQRLRSAGASPKDVREARKDVLELVRELGFTPRERARLGLAEVKAASKLEEIRARRAKVDHQSD